MTEENIILIVIMMCFQWSQPINYHRSPIGAKCEGGWTCSTLEYCLEKLDIKTAKPEICSFNDRTAVMCCPPEPSLYARSVIMGKCEKYAAECTDCKIKGKITNSISEVQSNTVNSRLHGRRYMVPIGYGDQSIIKWLCVGSIISHKFILSAANCAQNVGGNRNIARWIKLDDKDKINPAIIKIKQRVIHPDYTPPLLYHDIALFRLDKSIIFNSWIQPVCLSTELSHVYPHTTATLSGLEQLGEIRRERQLIEVYMPIIDTKVCNRLIRDEITLPNGVESESMICAGLSQKDSDPCQGGQCSPLVINSTSSNLKLQIGIETLPNTLGVYTKIASYLPWIQSIVWP